MRAETHGDMYDTRYDSLKRQSPGELVVPIIILQILSVFFSGVNIQIQGSRQLDVSNIGSFCFLCSNRNPLEDSFMVRWNVIKIIHRVRYYLTADSLQTRPCPTCAGCL